MGEGGNQPIITQRSFKSVLPKSFLSFLHLFCTNVCLDSSDPAPLPPNPAPPPQLWIRLSVWLWWSSVGLVELVGLVALTSPARCTAQSRHQRRSSTCLCFSFQPHHRQKQTNTVKDETQHRTENSSPGFSFLKVYFCFLPLENLRAQFATVFFFH